MTPPTNRMISYAQQGEDVVLARIFRHLDAGFYIDVGANHPTKHSVTRHFYEKGWCGINIEPVPQMHQLLELERPRDTNLRVAVSDTPGRSEFHEVVGSEGLSALEPEIAITSAESAGTSTRTYEVEVTTLAAIVVEYGVAQCEFLKVDAEGAEAAVVRGADFTTFRPRVVVIESTRPLSGEQSHHDWSEVLEAQSYTCTLFDGLNRYFVADEAPELVADASIPANSLDRYDTYQVTELRRRLSESRTKASRLEHRIARRLSRPIRGLLNRR